MTIAASTTVCVLGAGAWGLALADHLARQGAAVRVWDRDTSVISALRQTRTVNRPAGLVVHPGVTYYDTIIEAAEPASIILSVVPSFATKDMCAALKPITWADPGAIFVNCSKGIEPGTLRLPWEIFRDEIGTRPDLRYGVLAGPSHAEEVSHQVPTAVVASAVNPDDAALLQELFTSPTFRVYIQHDYKGVELGGAMKNVLAIVLGISDGLGYGDNTKAALITRGLAEITRLAVARGSSADTVAGLSGLGDLIVTTMSKHSRNRGFGELLSRGKSPEEAMEEIGAVVEGYLTTESAWQLARREGVEMPILDTIHAVLYESMGIETAIQQLLDRNPREEY
jgi:glycerol-3-phosphate dehydrogenase (NAD(P)+)